MDLQEQAAKERGRVDAKFLRELAGKEGVSDVDVEGLRRIADSMDPDRVEPETDGAVGLNRWSSGNWNRRPLQTGMEQENEKIVLGLINLLTAMEVPFYILHEVTKQKTGRQYHTIERMEMMREMFVTARSTAKTAAAAATTADHRAKVAAERVEVYRLAMDAAVEELRQVENFSDRAARAKVILENVEPTMETVKYGEPDDRGVRRVTLDARVIILRLCMQRIVHDLAPNEQICKRCLGLGMIKLTAPYGLGKQKPNEDAFPFFHQWLSDCHDCYMGKSVHCEYCKAALPRSRTQCECTAARSALAAVAHEKEMERRKTLPRIKLEAYEHPMAWCDDTDKFVDVDHLADHLVEHPDATIFACHPSEVLTKPEAEDIIEALQNSATETASPEDGDDVLDFSKEAEPELDAFLEEWAKKYVSARTLYYPDMNLIVEVPCDEDDRADAVPELRATDVAGGE